jgi:hypothetical protein
MKKLVSLCLCLAIMVGMCLPCFASETTTRTIDLGDGITVVQELTVQNAARSTSRTVTNKETFYSGSTKIAVIAITGTFRYDGSTVSVTSKSVSQSDTYDSWSFSQSSFTSSGGTISLSGKLTKVLKSVSVSMTLSCDKDGTISYS